MNTSPISPDDDGEADPEQLGCLFGCIGVIVCLVLSILWTLWVAWTQGGLNGRL